MMDVCVHYLEDDARLFQKILRSYGTIHHATTGRRIEEEKSIVYEKRAAG